MMSTVLYTTDEILNTTSETPIVYWLIEFKLKKRNELYTYTLTIKNQNISIH